MGKEEIRTVVARQRAYYRAGHTLPLKNRAAALKKLYRVIRENEPLILKALAEDLGKSRQEAYMCEIGMTLAEITYMLKHLRAFAGDKRVKTPLTSAVARSCVRPVPYGNVLIMSPWNYPFLLTLEPAVDALAAGNTCVMKPSAYSPASGRLISRLIRENFDPGLLAVVEGGREENVDLLEEKFDYIFFTGSQAVGRRVMAHAAAHLTPVSLELGGKSPCIVDETANIPMAARRIVFGKFLNCGQTCVAPDHIYVREEVRDKLIRCIRREMVRQYGPSPLRDPDYGRIVNRKHFDRLLGLMDKDKVVMGGHFREETLQIEPTLMVNVTETDPVMGEEIFGPILPILTYRDTRELIDRLKDKPHPLALYCFSENRKTIREITRQVNFGGGCINDTIIHLASSDMGFGGVGESGMGSYHGKAGFDTFSHNKSIVDRKSFVEFPLRYRPYSPFWEGMVRLLMK